MTRQITRRELIVTGSAVVAIGIAACGLTPVRAAGAPQVQRVRVSQTNLARGNRFTVTVNIAGDVHAPTITYRTPRGGTLTQTLRMTYGDNYEASFLVATDAPIGEYQVDAIVVRDFGNRVAYRIAAGDAAFADLVRTARVTVTTDGNLLRATTQPPDNAQSTPARIATAAPLPVAPSRSMPGAGSMLAFVSTSVSQNLLASGNAFTVRVVVRGAVDTVRVTYAYSGGERTQSLFFDYANGDDSHYESTFAVTDAYPIGRYVLSRLYAEDVDGSVLDLTPSEDDPLVAGSVVTVTRDGNPVASAPAVTPGARNPPAIGLAPPPILTEAIQFTAVTVAPRTVRPGGSVAVIATLTDTDGVIVGQPVVTFSDGRYELFAFFTAMRSGVYRAVVSVSPYYPEGRYTLTRLYAYDDRGNTFELHPPDTSAFGADITVRA